ncbi:MAG TPA: formyltransferase family protein [Polyangiaceae bacterium]|nr:formyltransferase family protein [Polyangiaceae bacterium]
MVSRFRVAYFGLPLGACLLTHDGHELALAVLPPIDAPGRRRLTRRSPSTRVLAAAAGLGTDENDGFGARVLAALERAAPDLLVSWFWTRRLPATWLACARFGGIGVHPSLLPRHRGPNPYYAAIDAGDRETGVTVHTLTPEYDEGDILLTRSLSVGERDSWQLARALDRPSLALLREAVGRYARGEPPEPRAQSAEGVTWAPEPDGDALHVEWNWPTARVLRRIRALAPVPGLGLEVEGLELFATRAAEAGDYPSALEPGEAAVYGTPPRLVLRTGDGAISVLRAVLPQEDDGPDAVLGPDELAAAVRSHLASRDTGDLG